MARWGLHQADTIAGPSHGGARVHTGSPVVSEISVTVADAGMPAERAVTTGTRAWELFADIPEVIAARVDGELR